MTRALDILDAEPGALAIVESELLAALMVCPYLRLDVGSLRPEDFVSPFRGVAFRAILAVKRPTLGLVCEWLEANGHQPPADRTGWGDALSRLIGMDPAEDDFLAPAIKAIKEAACRRKLRAIMGGADGAGAD